MAKSLRHSVVLVVDSFDDATASSDNSGLAESGRPHATDDVARSGYFQVT